MHTKQDCGPCKLYIGSLTVTSAMTMTHRSGFHKYSIWQTFELVHRCLQDAGPYYRITECRPFATECRPFASQW